MNIEEFKNYKEKTIAEFHVAIAKADNLFIERIKNKDIIGALEATKSKIKLEGLLNKKVSDGIKNGYDSHKRT